jgi:hypothetical protein
MRMNDKPKNSSHEIKPSRRRGNEVAVKYYRRIVELGILYVDKNILLSAQAILNEIESGSKLLRSVNLFFVPPGILPFLPRSRSTMVF